MIVLSNIRKGLQRVNHAAVAVDGLIYSFGGFLGTADYSEERPIDVHTLDMTTLRWEEFEYFDGGNPDNVPCIRHGHSVVAYNDIIYLWGGRRCDVSYNKMFMFDTNTRSWLSNEVKGTIPGARDGHAACIHEGFMYIFGGLEDASQEFSDTVYRFEFETLTWTALPELTSELLKKDYPTSVTIENKIYFFGGRSYSCPFYENNIMELDLDMMTWTAPDVVGFKPIGRRSQSAVVVDNKMVIFGGYNDIYEEHYNDFTVFDPKKCKWKTVNVYGANPPTARRRHCCVAVNAYLYIFGGSCPMPGDSGAQEHLLTELDDLIVLDTSRSLRSMVLKTIIDNNLSTKGLATVLAREVENYRTDNSLVCSEPEVLDLTLKSDDRSEK